LTESGIYFRFLDEDIAFTTASEEITKAWLKEVATEISSIVVFQIDMRKLIDS